MKGPILLVPRCDEGFGGGHLVRSAELARAIRKAGGKCWLFCETLQAESPLFSTMGDLFIKKENVLSGAWGLIVLDRFRTNPEELAFWASLGPVAGIDEGGCRDGFDFLVDLLPGPPGISPPNILKLAFLPLPEKRRPSFTMGAAAGQEAARGPFRILLSFGAEDRAGLTVPVALAVAQILTSQTSQNSRDALENKKTDTETAAPRISVRLGPLYKNAAEDRAALEKAGINVEMETGGESPAFREGFSAYDLIITHYGLSAFEALAARVPVLLVSPGKYHETLAKNAGFISAGIGGRNKKAWLKRLLKLLFKKIAQKKGGPAFILDEKKIRRITRDSEDAARRWGLVPAKNENSAGGEAKKKADDESLADFFLSWEPVFYRNCPVCTPSALNLFHEPAHRLLARFPERTYRLCGGCGTVFLSRNVPPSQGYDANYFFEDYKKQYGKTYLEDFSAIKKNGERRLEHIAALLARRGLSSPFGRRRSLSLAASAENGEKFRLLDIGCAYGPFLEAAREAGFESSGLDPSEEAVRYVSETLKIPAARGFFPEDAPFSASFHALSLWFVIEHLKDPHAALAAANKLLLPGGVLAFSTPSFSGISGRKNPKTFLENSPGDHFTVWNPKKCVKILAKFGFKAEKRVITGHHPERFPLVGRFLKPDSFFWYFFLALSRFFALGDSFEVYAVKTGPGGGKQ